MHLLKSWIHYVCNGRYCSSYYREAQLFTNVAKQVGDKVQKAYSNAPKNSLRGRLYSNAGFQKGLKLGGRGLLRFMGPWGYGAWIAWELGNWL